MQIQPITTNKKQAQPHFGMALDLKNRALSRIVKHGHGDELDAALPAIIKKAEDFNIKFWTSPGDFDRVYITVMPLTETGKSSVLKELFYAAIDRSGIKPVRTKTSDVLDFSELTDDAITRFNIRNTAKAIVDEKEVITQKKSILIKINDSKQDQ